VIPDVRCRKIKSVSTAGRKTFRWNRCIGKATTTSSAVSIIVGMMGFFSDAEKLAENESAQKQQMVTDPITGLANSRGIMESMTSYLEEFWRRNVNFVIMQVFVREYEFFRKTCGEEAGMSCCEESAGCWKKFSKITRSSEESRKASFLF
jgi:hypothetical protein